MSGLRLRTSSLGDFSLGPLYHLILFHSFDIFHMLLLIICYIEHSGRRIGSIEFNQLILSFLKEGGRRSRVNSGFKGGKLG